MSDQENPETTPENGAGKLLGSLEDHEVQMITELRVALNNIAMEVGQLEIRKARVLGSFQEVEGRIQEILSNASKRFNIPPGQTWHAMPNGEVRLGGSSPPG